MISKCINVAGLLFALAQAAAGAAASNNGFFVMPDETNAVRLRLYTNASPEASRVFNTFDLEAYGETLLASIGKDERTSARPSLLVNGRGPAWHATNSMRVLEEARGEGWRFVRLDATPAYREELKEYY